MPSYRLLAGFAPIVEIFDAADDEGASTVARKLSWEFPMREPLLEGRADFRVERCEADGWKTVFAWMPGR
jgi:hypothetical protein